MAKAKTDSNAVDITAFKAAVVAVDAKSTAIRDAMGSALPALIVATVTMGKLVPALLKGTRGKYAALVKGGKAEHADRPHTYATLSLWLKGEHAVDVGYGKLNDADRLAVKFADVTDAKIREHVAAYVTATTAAGNDPTYAGYFASVFPTRGADAPTAASVKAKYDAAITAANVDWSAHTVDGIKLIRAAAVAYLAMDAWHAAHPKTAAAKAWRDAQTAAAAKTGGKSKRGAKAAA